LRALPEDVDKVFEPPDVPGAKQPLAYDGATRGYLGPCPGSVHTYQFALYPIDVNPLPGVTQSSSRNAVRNALLLHVVGGAASAATLTGTYTPQ
jgi:phosphatidylethanolamine-binding protein (PEBP) family uncharacterized protein